MFQKLLIIVVSIALLLVYRGFRGNNTYVSPRGLVLAGFLGISLVIKWKTTGAGTLLFGDAPPSFLINIAMTVAALIFLYAIRIQKHSFSIIYTGRLFIAYLFLAFAEQLLFLYVFSETFYAITGNIAVSAFAASIYFRAFHTDVHLNKYSFLLYLLPFFWSVTYLMFGSIIWPAFSLAVIGPFYYSFLSDKRVITI